MLNPDVAQAISETYSIGQLKTLRATAVEVFMNSAHVQRSFEGSNLTISKDNAESIIAAVNAAIALKTTADPALNPPGADSRIALPDFRGLQVM